MVSVRKSTDNGLEDILNQNPQLLETISKMVEISEMSEEEFAEYLKSKGEKNDSEN